MEQHTETPDIPTYTTYRPNASKYAARGVGAKFAYEPMKYPELDDIKAEARRIHSLLAKGEIVEAMSLVDDLTQQIQLLPQFDAITGPILNDAINAVEGCFPNLVTEVDSRDSGDSEESPSIEVMERLDRLNVLNPVSPNRENRQVKLPIADFKPTEEAAKQYDSVAGENSTGCTICMENEPRCLFGCGHATCIACAIRNPSKCPVCKAVINSYIGPIYV